MIEIVVEQQAGGRWDAMADEARGLVPELAGPVQDITGLDLGPEVHLRLVNPDDFALQHEAYVRRVREAVLAGDALAAIADPVRRQKAEAALRTGAAVSAGTNRRISCVPSARMIQYGDGRSVVLLAPAQLPTGSLRAALAHMLTHQAQIRAGGPMPGVDAVAALLVHRAGGGTREDDPVLGALWEGHARWTTGRVLGRDAAGERLTGLAGRLLARLPGVRAELDTHDRAETFVRYLVESSGTATVNRIWTDHTLIPTRRELTTPATWLTRTGLEPQDRTPES
ncbi:zinc-dependent metalloprotease [Kitasatospora aureofaciens]|uniref:zinc-dependent metalloprotease n=1 Tax=Kitasatospora aureofaciens TaxID=1894 RepID=UPI001C44631E|nr:zinc-dependent metalloprotease [Kitasatospora aureofaciens]MBV6697306.1 zinc-dependent metalloprotease [Kitasatospora aureofaciens]